MGHYTVSAIWNGRVYGEKFLIIEVLSGSCLGCGASDFKMGKCSYCSRQITNKEAGL